MPRHNAAFAVDSLCLFCKAALHRRKPALVSRSLSSSATTPSSNVSSPLPRTSPNAAAAGSVPYGAFFQRSVTQTMASTPNTATQGHEPQLAIPTPAQGNALINGGRLQDPKVRHKPKRKAQDKKTDDPWATLLPPSFNASPAAKETIQIIDARDKGKSTPPAVGRPPSIRYVNLLEKCPKCGSEEHDADACDAPQQNRWSMKTESNRDTPPGYRLSKRNDSREDALNWHWITQMQQNELKEAEGENSQFIAPRNDPWRTPLKKLDPYPRRVRPESWRTQPSQQDSPVIKDTSEPWRTQRLHRGSIPRGNGYYSHPQGNQRESFRSNTRETLKPPATSDALGELEQLATASQSRRYPSRQPNLSVPFAKTNVSDPFSPTGALHSSYSESGHRNPLGRHQSAKKVLANDFLNSSETQESCKPRETEGRKSKLSYLLERMSEEEETVERQKEKGQIKRRKRDGHRETEMRTFMTAEERAQRRETRKEEKRRHAKEAIAKQQSRLPQISLPQHISVTNLATLLDVKFDHFLTKLEQLGFTQTAHDHVLSAEDAGLIAMEYGCEPLIDNTAEDIVAAELPEDLSSLPTRPPVVTIMGHVDHGKTTILDYLRKSSIAASEHGGITQHIGAFSVQLSSGKTITFLDTPGHAAFLSMRQRGANVTDIVVLVVAADDGVMPQTLEAIKHAKSANVPIIVAINKVDKPDANPDRAKQDLARHEVQIEDFGGDTQVVCVSGKTGKGMDELEESIITLSEILDNRAPIDGPVEGWLLESSMKTYGRVGTVLVRRGFLRPGNIIVAGRTWARIKTLRNEAGALVGEVGPGMPVEVDGWKGPPTPGDEVLQATDEQHAAAVVRGREAIAESLRLAQDMKAINESRRLQREVAVDEEENEDGQREKRVLGAFQENKATSGIQEVPFIVKADVIGSVEAVVNLISGLGNSDVRPHIIRSGAGAVTEGDVELAAAANGYILAFNTDLEPSMQGSSEEVQILRQSVIYRVAEDVNRVLEGAMPYFVTQRVTGEAEVAQSFSITLPGKVQLLVAGCKVRNGLVTKGSRVKVMRGGEIVHDGLITSLKNVKKEVSEMKKDTECGMSFNGWDAFEVGDKVQCYSETKQKKSLTGDHSS